MIPGTNGWKAVFRFWFNPQIGLQKVIRWEKYIKTENGGARRQDSLQHSHSIVLLTTIVMGLLRKYLHGVDWSMLLTAVAVHDTGEGELGRDTHYIDKTVDGDVAEWIAFRKLTEGLPLEVRLAQRQAFLLQFCLNGSKAMAFPADAQEIMQELAARYRIEAQLFDIVERWDYVIYAQEQYETLGNEIILVQTLRHQIHHLNRLAKEVPGFAKEIWTEEVRTWHQHFLDIHEDDWPESRSA